MRGNAWLIPPHPSCSSSAATSWMKPSAASFRMKSSPTQISHRVLCFPTWHSVLFEITYRSGDYMMHVSTPSEICKLHDNKKIIKSSTIPVDRAGRVHGVQ